MWMDVFRNFRANSPCHFAILRKERSYRIRRYLLLCPVDHGIEQRSFAVAVMARMKFVQILFAVLDRSAEQGNCPGFSPLAMQVHNWMLCIKAQIADLHIEEFTASGGGIIHEDHEYQIPQIFLP